MNTNNVNVLDYLPQVRLISRRLLNRFPKYVEFGDLLNLGVIGLLDAKEKFRPLENKTSFKTYAEFRIRGEILDELRSLDCMPRSLREKESAIAKVKKELTAKLGHPPDEETIVAKIGISLGEYQTLSKKISNYNKEIVEFFEDIFLSEEEPFTDKIGREEIFEILKKCLKKIPLEESTFIYLYYYGGKTIKEVGTILGMHESSASRLHTKACLNLKKYLAEEGVTSFCL